MKSHTDIILSMTFLKVLKDFDAGQEFVYRQFFLYMIKLFNQKRGKKKRIIIKRSEMGEIDKFFSRSITKAKI